MRQEYTYFNTKAEQSTMWVQAGDEYRGKSYGGVADPWRPFPKQDVGLKPNADAVYEYRRPLPSMEAEHFIL